MKQSQVPCPMCQSTAKVVGDRRDSHISCLDDYGRGCMWSSAPPGYMVKQYGVSHIHVPEQFREEEYGDDIGKLHVVDIPKESYIDYLNGFLPSIPPLPLVLILFGFVLLILVLSIGGAILLDKVIL